MEKLIINSYEEFEKLLGQRIGKLVDTFLRHFQPVGDTDALA